MNACELAYLPRVAIDISKAAQQHLQYEASLRDLGVSVVSLPAVGHSPAVEAPEEVANAIAALLSDNE